MITKTLLYNSMRELCWMIYHNRDIIANEFSKWSSFVRPLPEIKGNFVILWEWCARSLQKVLADLPQMLMLSRFLSKQRSSLLSYYCHTIVLLVYHYCITIVMIAIDSILRYANSSRHEYLSYCSNVLFLDPRYY